MDKVTFKDLSWQCKVGIVSGWVVGAIFCFSWLIGFVVGVLSV